LDEFPSPISNLISRRDSISIKIILLPINFTKNEHETLRITGKNK
jgi:hypothetical protein